MNTFSDKFETFTAVVAVAYKHIQKIKSNEAKKVGIKGSHISCLYYLGQNPEGLTAAELCRLCDLDKAAVSRIVAELMENGSVTAVEGKRNYRMPIRLTERGKEINDCIGKAIQNAVKKATEGFNEEERACFYRVFFSITDNLATLIESEEQQ